MLNEAVVTYFKVLSHILSGGTKENVKESGSRQTASGGLRLQAGTSRIQM
jgi:hypothetical protein